MALPVRRSNGNATAEVSRQQPLAELDRLNRQLGDIEVR